MGGRDPYSASKGCAELVDGRVRGELLRATGAAAVATARAGNVIGGGDWAPDRIVPDCVRALTAGRPIVVRNPDAVRPWQHVLEPLAGYLLLGAALLDDGARLRGRVELRPCRRGRRPDRALGRRAVHRGVGRRVRGSLRRPASAQPHEAHAPEPRQRQGDCERSAGRRSGTPPRPCAARRRGTAGITRIRGSDARLDAGRPQGASLPARRACWADRAGRQVTTMSAEQPGGASRTHPRARRRVPPGAARRGRRSTPRRTRCATPVACSAARSSTLSWTPASTSTSPPAASPRSSRPGSPTTWTCPTRCSSTPDRRPTSSPSRRSRRRRLGDRRLRPGDEVLTVAAGFPSTVAPIVQNGLVPVFVDVSPGRLQRGPGRSCAPR